MQAAFEGDTHPKGRGDERDVYELTSEGFVRFIVRNLWSAAWLPGWFDGGSKAIISMRVVLGGTYRWADP
jgi:hypothetical protein